MQDDFNESIKKLPPHELVVLLWHLQRRPEQTPPTPLPFIWFLLGGRGSGKTKTGANHVYETAKNLPHTSNNRIVRVALISETFTDVRITMIEGETGLRSIIPREMELAWNRSLGELKVVIPGSQYREVHFFAYSSERPDLLRGPQHHIAWVDEPAKLKDADIEPTSPNTTWSNMMMGLRLGPTPHAVITGTPLPSKLIKYIAAHPSAICHKMSTFDNEANLPQATIEEFRRLPKTSRTARQELFAEILLDNPDSIFAQEVIDNNRQDPENDLNLVLGYDPSMTANDESDEAGIILGGYRTELDQETQKKLTHAYILEDFSGHFTPQEQINTVTDIILHRRVPEFVFEQNQGAGFVLNTLKTAIETHPLVQSYFTREKAKKPTKAGTIKRIQVTVVFKDKNEPPHTFIIHMIHAKVGKVLRADMVSVRYETGQVHHPTQGLPICPTITCSASLEDQMVLWDETKKDSPDRMDAAVYVLLLIFGAEHALTSKKAATISTTRTAHAPQLPSYNPLTSLERLPVATTPSQSRHSRAYNVDIGGSGNNDPRSRMGIAGIRKLPPDEIPGS